MAIYYYKASPQAPPQPSVVTRSGSITSAKAGTKSFWLQYRTIQGMSRVSSRVDIAIAEGQGLDVIIPGSALPTDSTACYISEYLILMAEATDPMTASVVASVPGFSGSTVLAPPFTVSLLVDEHFKVEVSQQSVTAPSDLPSVNRINGMRRYVDLDPAGLLTGRIVEWQTASNTWVEVNPQRFNTYLSDDKSVNGARQNLGDLIDYSSVLAPSYNLDDGVVSRAVGFWLENDEAANVDQGTLVSFGVELNGISIASTAGLLGGIEVRFDGYVNVTSGILDTFTEDGSTTMAGVGSWVPYQGNQTYLSLPKPLGSGYAYCLSVRLSFTAAHLGGRAIDGAEISFKPYFFSNFAIYNPTGEALGSFILPLEQRRRIVPGRGLQAFALPGKGQIIYPGAGAFVFPLRGRQFVPGLSLNLANQNIAINISGTCFVVSSLTDDMKLRAIAGTLDGIGQSPGWKAISSLDSSKQVVVIVTLPVAVRSDYPDRRIAGYSQGSFNATKIHVYYRQLGSPTIYRYETAVAIGSETQQITIGGIAGAGMGSTPNLDRPFADFGLYDPTLAAFSLSTISGSSVFSANNGEVTIRFEYSGTLTSLSHDPRSGCIGELSGDIVALGDRQIYWAEAVASISSLPSLPPEEVVDGQVRIITELGEPYKYRASTSSWTPLSPSQAVVADLDELRLIPAPIPAGQKFFVQSLQRYTRFDAIAVGAETGSGIFKPFNLPDSAPGRHLVEI